MRQINFSRTFQERPGPVVLKLYSCPTQLSTKFQLLIKTKMPTNKGGSCYKSLSCCFIMLINVKMPTIVGILTFISTNNCLHFNIYEQDRVNAQLSWAWKSFITSGLIIKVLFSCFAMFFCDFVTFPCGVLGKVWYLIVSILDLCLLPYFSSLCEPCALIYLFFPVT